MPPVCGGTSFFMSAGKLAGTYFFFFFFLFVFGVTLAPAVCLWRSFSLMSPVSAASVGAFVSADCKTGSEVCFLLQRFRVGSLIMLRKSDDRLDG